MDNNFSAFTSPIQNPNAAPGYMLPVFIPLPQAQISYIQVPQQNILDNTLQVLSPDLRLVQVAQAVQPSSGVNAGTYYTISNPQVTHVAMITPQIQPPPPPEVHKDVPAVTQYVIRPMYSCGLANSGLSSNAVDNPSSGSMPPFLAVRPRPACPLKQEDKKCVTILPRRAIQPKIRKQEHVKMIENVEKCDSAHTNNGSINADPQKPLIGRINPVSVQNFREPTFFPHAEDRACKLDVVAAHPNLPKSIDGQFANVKAVDGHDGKPLAVANRTCGSASLDDHTVKLVFADVACRLEAEDDHASQLTATENDKRKPVAAAEDMFTPIATKSQDCKTETASNHDYMSVVVDDQNSVLMTVAKNYSWECVDENGEEFSAMKDQTQTSVNSSDAAFAADTPSISIIEPEVILSEVEDSAGVVVIDEEANGSVSLIETTENIEEIDAFRDMLHAVTGCHPKSEQTSAGINDMESECIVASSSKSSSDLTSADLPPLEETTTKSRDNHEQQVSSSLQDIESISEEGTHFDDVIQESVSCSPIEEQCASSDMKLQANCCVVLERLQLPHNVKYPHNVKLCRRRCITGHDDKNREHLKRNAVKKWFPCENYIEDSTSDETEDCSRERLNRSCKRIRKSGFTRHLRSHVQTQYRSHCGAIFSNESSSQTLPSLVTTEPSGSDCSRSQSPIAISYPTNNRNDDGVSGDSIKPTVNRLKQQVEQQLAAIQRICQNSNS